MGRDRLEQTGGGAVVTSEELRKASCEACGCDDPNCGLALNSRCHPGAGVRVTYFRNRHTLEIKCARCETPVVAIALPQLS